MKDGKGMESCKLLDGLQKASDSPFPANNWKGFEQSMGVSPDHGHLCLLVFFCFFVGCVCV